MSKRIFVIGAVPESLINFRLDFLLELKNLGFDVYTVSNTPTKETLHKLESLGINHISLYFNRTGINPVKDLYTLFQLFILFYRLKPHKVIAYTIKPVIWAGVASKFLNIPFYGMITGLGYAFQKGGRSKYFLNKIVCFLYKFALSSSTSVIFQNKDNLKVFVDNNIVMKNKTYIVNGSGVNLDFFKFKPIPKTFRFLLIARLLKAKGIFEYIEAAKVVKKSYPNIFFDLLGPCDTSPDGISLDSLSDYFTNDLISYRGFASDVRPFINDCTVFVLPSYHEGMPRSVLEAMSIGRPIITTDVPGCRDTVIPGYNGWLVDKFNVSQLVKKMIWFIENIDECVTMGINSHNFAKEKFDVKKVNLSLIKILEGTYEKNI